MKASLRQTMSTLHTWTGLLPGWLLFVIFLFGTVAFFQQEISQWMRPELTPAPVSAKSIDAADAILRKEGAGKSRVGRLRNRLIAADGLPLPVTRPVAPRTTSTRS